MRNRRYLIIGLAVLLLSGVIMALAPILAPFVSGKRRQSVSAWISAPGQAAAIGSIKNHADRLSSLSPMWYVINEQGRLKRDWIGDPKVAKAAIDRGIQLIPTISNRFDPTATAAMLTDPGLKRRFIDDTAGLIKKNGYNGIDLDFENMRAEDRDRFTRFVGELKSRLAPLGALLTLDLHAKTSEPGGWQGPISHDYAGLARHADQLRVMAYDEHYAGGPPGPIASLKWVRRVLRFAKSKVPPAKLVLGIPLYGYDWGESTPTKSVTFRQGVNEAGLHNATVKWDKTAAAPWFTYDLDGKRHTVWFENARSAAAKLDIPEAKNIRGFSFFRLGIEDPAVWQELDKRIYATY
ncbi:MAG: glycosyl hydrolase family 18 protein [Actinomycetota bacterium]|nr:glycosyl hydrolase family 18 protein [Actinomycetota bacterium]